MLTDTKAGGLPQASTVDYQRRQAEALESIAKTLLEILELARKSEGGAS